MKGDPDCEVVIHGWHPATIEAGLKRNPGIVVTAAHCVNSIPNVCEADRRPGDVRRPAAGDRSRPPGPGQGSECRLSHSGLLLSSSTSLRMIAS